jgi:hypothetical protein
VSRRDRRDGDRGRDRDRRDSQPDDEQQRRLGDSDIQESDSLTALKAILSKVAALLNPLQLTQDESIRLVEQLYGSVLAMDMKLAGEADDTRKSSVLAHIQNTGVSRAGDKIVVEYPVPRPERPQSAAPEPADAGVPTIEEPAAGSPAAQADPPAAARTAEAPAAAPEIRRPRTTRPRPSVPRTSPEASDEPQSPSGPSEPDPAAD